MSKPTPSASFQSLIFQHGSETDATLAQSLVLLRTRPSDSLSLVLRTSRLWNQGTKSYERRQEKHRRSTRNRRAKTKGSTKATRHSRTPKETTRNDQETTTYNDVHLATNVITVVHTWLRETQDRKMPSLWSQM